MLIYNNFIFRIQWGFQNRECPYFKFILILKDQKSQLYDYFFLTKDWSSVGFSVPFRRFIQRSMVSPAVPFHQPPYCNSAEKGSHNCANQAQHNCSYAQRVVQWHSWGKGRIGSGAMPNGAHRPFPNHFRGAVVQMAWNVTVNVTSFLQIVNAK